MLSSSSIHAFLPFEYIIELLLYRFDQVIRNFDGQQLWIHPFLFIYVLIRLGSADVVKQFDGDLAMIHLVITRVHSCIHVQDVHIDFQHIYKLFDAFRFDHIVPKIN